MPTRAAWALNSDDVGKLVPEGMLSLCQQIRHELVEGVSMRGEERFTRLPVKTFRQATYDFFFL